MGSNATLQQILRLEVPIVVQLGARTMRVSEVVKIFPGYIIELSKSSEAELDILVNNELVGTGTAVKVGENFGVRISFLGDAKARIAAMGMQSSASSSGGGRSTEMSPEQLAEALLAGQI